MHFLTKLKTTSLYKVLLNNLFLIFFLVVILLLALDSPIYVIFLVVYFIYLYKKNKKFAYIGLGVIIIILVLFLVRKQIIYDKNLNEFSGYVINKVKKDNYNRLLVRSGIYKVYIYDYDFLDIKIGDIITVDGINKKIEQNHLPNLFNYEKYYYSQNIISIIKADSITITKKVNYLFFRRWINDYIESTFDLEASSFIKGMVLGDTSSLSESASSAIKINNISHLFAISGLHINLIVEMNKKILNIFIKDDKKKDNIISVILIIYLMITNFAVSIMRAVSMYLLKIISDRLNLKLSSLDIASFVFIIMIIYNPFYIYHLGFILSFFACFVIIIFTQSINKLDIKLNSFLEIIFITLILQISTLPVIINVNNSFNLLSFITNGVFIMLVSFIILPFTFLSLLLPFLSSIYSYVIHAFNFLNEFFSNNFSINIMVPSFLKGEIIIYYLFILGFIIVFKDLVKKKKVLYICAFILFLFIHEEKINFNINGHIYFLDVYEGDATVIDLPFNKGVVIIDTGIESSDVISFLKSIGIRKIDYLIITHNHSDHNGNVKEIMKTFKVENIITSVFDESTFSTRKVKTGDEIKISNYCFYVLSPKERSNNENNNSIVLYSKLGNYRYLFLGDIEKEIEEDLSQYDLDVDCVKVAHHGSKTSTTKKLYDKINPKIVFIETGRVEKLGFPNKDVISFLSKYQIYQTNTDYTICATFNLFFSRIKKTKK